MFVIVVSLAAGKGFLPKDQTSNIFMVLVTIYSIEFGGHTYVGRTGSFRNRMGDHYRCLLDEKTKKNKNKKLYIYLRKRCSNYSELCGTTLSLYDIPRPPNGVHGVYNYAIADHIEQYWITKLRADLNALVPYSNDLNCEIYHNKFLKSQGGPVLCLKDAYEEHMCNYVLDTLLQNTIKEFRIPKLRFKLESNGLTNDTVCKSKPLSQETPEQKSKHNRRKIPHWVWKNKVQETLYSGNLSSENP